MGIFKIRLIKKKTMPQFDLYPFINQISLIFIIFLIYYFYFLEFFLNIFSKSLKIRLKLKNLLNIDRKHYTSNKISIKYFL
jgi:hypothetical protein